MKYNFSIESFKKSHITGHAATVDVDKYNTGKSKLLDQLAVDGISFKCEHLWNYTIDMIIRSGFKPHCVEKGLLMGGSTGCGKSTMLHLLMAIRGNVFSYSTAKDLERIFMKDEERYNLIVEEKKHLIVDDIGSEGMIAKYGRSLECIVDVIDIRYELFKHSGYTLTIATNLTPDSILKRYGKRSYSRLKEMTVSVYSPAPDQR